MRSEHLRPTLQLAFLLVIMPVLFFIGLGCYPCGAGQPGSEDYADGTPTARLHTRDTVEGSGASVLNRMTYFNDVGFSASALEMQAAQMALPGSFVGLLIPTAPSANGPGQLLDGASFTYYAGREDVTLNLRQDKTATARLAQAFPPAEGTQWFALVISDTQPLQELFSGQPISVTGVSAYARYQIDFGGPDLCNGCEVQVVACVPGQFAALFPPNVQPLITTVAQETGPTLTCSRPVSTYIRLFGAPGPIVAAFGLAGNQVISSTTGGTLVVPMLLEHTGTLSLTFDLAPIQSALGYTYTWVSPAAVPIDQVEVPEGQYDPNVVVKSTSLPTCTQAIDVLTLEATNTVTPSIAASAQFLVNIVPDPANCPLADVGAYHVQHTDIVTGGQSISYTLTITNQTDAVQDGMIQQTLTPAAAVNGATLPAECSLDANVVTCQANDIPAQSARSATVAIQVTLSYSGTLYSSVLANPVGATDKAYLDNVDGVLEATVVAGQPTDEEPETPPGSNQHLRLPLLTKPDKPY